MPRFYFGQVVPRKILVRTSERFTDWTLNLLNPDEDILVHMGLRSVKSQLAINSRIGGAWQKELLVSALPADWHSRAVSVQIVLEGDHCTVWLGDAQVASLPIALIAPWAGDNPKFAALETDQKLSAAEVEAAPLVQGLDGPHRFLDEAPLAVASADEPAVLLQVGREAALGDGGPFALCFDRVETVGNAEDKPLEAMEKIRDLSQSQSSGSLTICANTDPAMALSPAGSGLEHIAPERICDYVGQGSLSFEDHWSLVLRGLATKNLMSTGRRLVLDPAAEHLCLWRFRPAPGGQRDRSAEDIRRFLRQIGNAPLRFAEGDVSPVTARIHLGRSLIVVVPDGTPEDRDLLRAFERETRFVAIDRTGLDLGTDPHGEGTRNAVMRRAAALFAGHEIDRIVFVPMAVAQGEARETVVTQALSEGTLAAVTFGDTLAAMTVERTAFTFASPPPWHVAAAEPLDAASAPIPWVGPRRRLTPYPGQRAAVLLRDLGVLFDNAAEEAAETLLPMMDELLDRLLPVQPFLTLNIVHRIALVVGAPILTDTTNRIAALATQIGAEELTYLARFLNDHRWREAASILVRAARTLPLDESQGIRLAAEDADISTHIANDAAKAPVLADPAVLFTQDRVDEVAQIKYLKHSASAQDWDGILRATVDPQTLGTSEEILKLKGVALLKRGDLGALEDHLTAFRTARPDGSWNADRLSAELLYCNGRFDAAEAAIQDLIARHDVLKALRTPSEPFTRLTDRTPLVPKDEVAMVVVARNERTRLTWLLDHYRSLGVRHIFLIDNGSTDGSLEVFGAQPDVHIFSTPESYSAGHYGVKWHNALCDELLQDRWVLTVDADEILVYRDMDTLSLPDLCAALDEAGQEGLYTPQIDMYPDRPLGEVIYKPGMSLIETFAYFDGLGYERFVLAGSPAMGQTGGVRRRIFCSDGHDVSLAPFAMQKVALTKWTRGRRYLLSTHDMSPTIIDPDRDKAALLHFKFMPDFHARALEEVRRGEHYDGAREYRRYLAYLERSGQQSFLYPHSIRYDGFEALSAMRFRDNPDDTIRTESRPPAPQAKAA